MFVYSLEEVQEDIFAFEGVKIQALSSEFTGFSKLYSDWRTEPLDNEKTVDDLNSVLSEYVLLFSIPSLSTPIDPGKEYLLYSGCDDKPLDLIIATNDINEYKQHVKSILSKDSQYTIMFSIVGDETQYFTRKFNG